MRIKKYHVKGHAYTQLIDDNNFVHYVGPWNTNTLCICYHLIGWNETHNRDKKLRTYLKSHDIIDEEDIKSIMNYYYLGLNDKEAPSMLYDRIEELGHRIDLLGNLVEEYSHVPLVYARQAAWKTFQTKSKNERRKMLE